MTEYSWLGSKGTGHWNVARQHLTSSHLEILQAHCHTLDWLPRMPTLIIHPFLGHGGQGDWVHFGVQVSMWGVSFGSPVEHLLLQLSKN